MVSIVKVLFQKLLMATIHNGRVLWWHGPSEVHCKAGAWLVRKRGSSAPKRRGRAAETVFAGGPGVSVSDGGVARACCEHLPALSARNCAAGEQGSLAEALKRADGTLLASSYLYHHPGTNAKENGATPRGPAQTCKGPQGEDGVYNMQVSCAAGLCLSGPVLTLHL